MNRRHFPEDKCPGSWQPPRLRSKPSADDVRKIPSSRVLAAKKLGLPRIPVVEIRRLSKAQLKALRIADNRLAQHAHWDERLLGESFLELGGLDAFAQ